MQAPYWLSHLASPLGILLYVDFISFRYTGDKESVFFCMRGVSEF